MTRQRKNFIWRNPSKSSLEAFLAIAGEHGLNEQQAIEVWTAARRSKQKESKNE